MTRKQADITTKWHGLPAHDQPRHGHHAHDQPRHGRPAGERHGHPGHEGPRAGSPCHARQRRGFTVIELLVVMAIVILLVTIGAGSINQLLHSGRVESGVNTLSAAVASTRAQANRGLGGQGAFLGNTTYKGVALLVTPADMRIVQHVAIDENQGGADARENAYADIPNLDEIPLQRGTGFVGIARRPPRSDLLLFAPPFALRFNPDGQLVVRGSIFYDGNYDGQYVAARDRTSPHYGPLPYDPSVGIPGHDRYERSISYSTEHSRHIVPLEKIDTVIGVIVFSMDELMAADIDPDAYTNWPLEADGSSQGSIIPETRDWLLEQVENGTARLILFNRYTGTMLKDAR